MSSQEKNADLGLARVYKKVVSLGGSVRFGSQEKSEIWTDFS